MEYKGYKIEPARSTGGKAGKGNNLTSTIQVRYYYAHGYRIFRSIRFKVGDNLSQQKAIEKAKQWIDKNPEAK